LFFVHTCSLLDYLPILTQDMEEGCGDVRLILLNESFLIERICLLE
jgi:hypothetical protein